MQRQPAGRQVLLSHAQLAGQDVDGPIVPQYGWNPDAAARGTPGNRDAAAGGIRRAQAATAERCLTYLSSATKSNPSLNTTQVTFSFMSKLQRQKCDDRRQHPFPLLPPAPPLVPF